MKCWNCGAEIDSGSTKCPYCAAMQYKAAEKEYMGKLGGIYTKLKNLKQESTKSFWKEFVYASTKVLILALIAILIGFGKYKLGKIRENAEAEAERKKIYKEYDKYDQNIDEINALYNQGKFEELYEFLYKEGSSSYISMWKHKDVYQVYSDSGRSLYKGIKNIQQDKDWISEYTMSDAVISSLELIYLYDKNSLYYNGKLDSLDEEELQWVQKWQSDAKEFIYNTLEMTPDEVESVRKAAYSEKYFYSNNINDTIKQLTTKIKNKK